MTALRWLALRPMGAMVLIGLLMLALPCEASAARQDGDLRLLLRQAAGGASDVQLDVELRAGKPVGTAWAHALWFNAAHHPGRIEGLAVSEDALRFEVHVTLSSDGAVPGGAARLKLTLRRTGDEVTGQFEGQWLDDAVRGEVTGVVVQRRVEQVPSFEPPAAGEYPRLIFRQADVKRLHQRMQTPEGRAIMAMLTRRAPARNLQVVDDRRASWLAVNEGVLYHLVGDSDAPSRARRILIDEVVKKPLPADRADIHHAMRLLGVALAFDLCHDAWDEPFRRLMAGYLHTSMQSLHRGVYDGIEMSDIVREPWSHRNAIRMAAVGSAALALIDQRGPTGELFEDAPIIAQQAEQAVIAWLEMGVGSSGAAMEGEFYKAFALSNGVLQFMHALRTAAGRDLSHVNPMLLTGHLFDASAVPHERGHYDFGLSSISVQLSGRWPMGFSSIPREHLPVMRWAFDHSAGLQGARHFDCTYPYQAAYALMSYPFELEAMRPIAARDAVHVPRGMFDLTGEGHVWRGWVLGQDREPAAQPGVVLDPVVGRAMVRTNWQGAGDARVVLQTGGVHRGGALDHVLLPGTLRVEALGRTWIDDVVGLGPGNRKLGGVIEHAQSPRPGQLILRLRLDAMYMSDITPRPRRVLREDRWRGPQGPDPELLAQPDVRQLRSAEGVFRDSPVRVTRHVAIDLTGRCGAPVLVAIYDQIEGADQPWRWQFQGLRMQGQGFTVGNVSDAHMAGRFLLPESPRRQRGGVIPGEGVFVVFTCQSGEAPAIEPGQNPLRDATRIGQQTLRFDGQQFVFGH